ncbi:hypothetical protein CERZMDRAFT_97290 [Cercospora zeae-maydis SCOH1-5]|uniref:Uncharacterized protein n=1 Tax=Cercospora zeae-maydis SCOH1-5 TaxID=717836 RepID=A0A6A6FH96_9PEZI|nr:hypothetical protein CERZMDRAFT_97290 [Cercospora zeae-maydis SCOH1-5]
MLYKHIDKASGTSLDPEIFQAEDVADSDGNQVTVQPVPVIMTPCRATPGKPLYYPTNVANLARILRNRTGVAPIIYKYNPIRSDRDIDNRRRRGEALFEFEWDADG